MKHAKSIIAFVAVYGLLVVLTMIVDRPKASREEKKMLEAHEHKIRMLEYKSNHYHRHEDGKIMYATSPFLSKRRKLEISTPENMPWLDKIYKLIGRK